VDGPRGEWRRNKKNQHKMQTSPVKKINFPVDKRFSRFVTRVRRDNKLRKNKKKNKNENENVIAPQHSRRN